VRVVALNSGNPLRRERLPVVLIASLALRMRFLMRFLMGHMSMTSGETHISP
jgi:hypothetical protein